MNFESIRITIGGWLISLAGRFLHDQPEASILNALGLDDLPDDPDSNGIVIEEYCSHPEDERVAAPRMGNPRVWTCRICKHEGGLR